MNTLILLIILPLLSSFALLLSGFLLLKELMPLRAIVGGLLVLAGGAGMLAQHDYTWAAAILKELPADAVIVQEMRSSLVQHPWTLLAPPVTHLAAIHNVRETLELDGAVWLEFDLLRFAFDRGNLPDMQTVMLNCTSFDRVTRQANGILIESLPEADPILQLLCEKN